MTIIVLAKEPVPGRVKTRLVPPLTHEQAAELAAAALADTMSAIDTTAFDDKLLAFDGDAASWLGRGWRAVAQPSGGLDARLVAAFRAVDGPSVLVGMDTPQLRADQVLAFDPDRYDAALGLSTDGGYWVIALADPRLAERAIRGIPMSAPTTGTAQLQRLEDLGLRVQILDVLTDVDAIESAELVAAQAPHTAFARAFRNTKQMAS